MRPICALIFMAAALQAQGTLSVAEAVQRALSSHPLLQAAAERVAAFSGFSRQAGLRPNPRFSFQTENWRASGVPSFSPGEETDTYAFLTQPLETAGKRSRRTELAGANVRRMELERELLSRQIATRVKQAYWSAAGAGKIHALWLETGRTFQQIVEYHEARVREGVMAEADLLKVRLEGERLAVSANSAALDAERARIQLFREMGQTEFPAVTLGDPLELGSPPADANVERALQDRTEIKLAMQAQEQARANLRFQRALAAPDLDLVFGYKRTGGFNTALGGLQIGVPFSNRNQGNIAAAEAEIRAGDSELAAAQAIVRAEVRAARAEVEMRRHQITGLLKESLERAAESSRIAQAAYREGGADLLRLLDAERVRIDLEVLYVRTLADYRQSVVALETAMGVNP